MQRRVSIVALCRELARHRVAQGLTQYDLGQRMGIDKAEVCRIERGHKDCHVSTLIRYADALDVELHVTTERKPDA